MVSPNALVDAYFNGNLDVEFESVEAPLADHPTRRNPAPRWRGGGREWLSLWPAGDWPQMRARTVAGPSPGSSGEMSVRANVRVREFGHRKQITHSNGA